MEVIPNGIYSAKFLGCEDHDITRTRNSGKVKIDRYRYWQFKILTGPYAGHIVTRHTGRYPNEGTACGKMTTILTTAVDGKPLAGSEFCPVLYEGALVRVVVKDGVIDDVWSARTFRVRIPG